jgi:hypothetical protein
VYDLEKLDEAFSTHGLNAGELALCLELEARFRLMARWILEHLPPGPHRTSTIDKLIAAKDEACLALLTTPRQRKDV